MLKKISLFSLIVICTITKNYCQELFVFSEPASNKPKGSLTFRLGTMVMPMNNQNKNSTRIMPEIMIGVSKKLMLNAQLYAGNMLYDNIKLEGASISAKYRFYSKDEVHKHFRMAAFAGLSISGNPIRGQHSENHLLPDGMGGFVNHLIPVVHTSNELDVEGNHSGTKIGLITTYLKNRTAFSITAQHVSRMDNLNNNKFFFSDTRYALQANIAVGYLCFPKEIKDYKQTNFNIYNEIILQQSIDNAGGFIDLAPAVQFIFHSNFRVDFGYRFQILSTIKRFNNKQALIKLEYNLFNFFNKKSK